MGLKDLGKQPPAGNRMEVIRSFGDVASVGLSFALALLIGIAAGLWLDRQFGWKPYGFFGGFILGLAAGVRNVYLVTRKYLK